MGMWQACVKTRNARGLGPFRCFGVFSGFLFHKPVKGDNPERLFA